MRLNIGPEAAPEKGLFNQHERRRMIMLAGLLLVIATVFIVSLNKENKRRREEAAEGVPTQEVVTVVAKAPIDYDRLRELADDSTPEARVLVGAPALEAAFRDARLLSPKHFAPMNGRGLDREVIAELLADPTPHRGQLFRMRGQIEEITPFDSISGSTAHYRGRMRMPDGSAAYFAALTLQDLRGEVGEFASLEGLFLENHRRQGPDGWIEAPLIVGPRAVLSFPELEPVLELEPMAFVGVTDDDATSITGQPFTEYWKLASYAQHLDESFDWSKAALLNAENYNDMRRDGTSWRGRPVRIPPSKLMDISNQAQKENPLRLEKMTEGWIGNWDWTSGTGLVRFVAPFTNETLKMGDVVEARGFFLKHSAYEMRDGGIGIVPTFVVHSIEGSTPVEDNTWTIVLAVLGGSLLLFCLAIGLALMRDRKNARALQDELKRRRRARRAQPQST